MVFTNGTREKRMMHPRTPVRSESCLEVLLEVFLSALVIANIVLWLQRLFFQIHQRLE
uniref:Uncharacterized protein n=1 Tax=Oryzias latipes TaxID=8090 RepID=A0A286P9V1_ORYLA|nr:hypothetical protein [Oryzias latipes]